MNDDYVQARVRRRVGMAALRRLRALVDADSRQRQADARVARRLSWLFVAAALVAVLWLALR